MPVTLPPSDVLAGNLLAVPLVWGWAALAGLPFVAMLRVRLGFAAAPLCGLAYWAASLYLLPFRGGLDVAMAVAAVAGSVTLVRQRHRAVAAFRRAARSPAAWLLRLLLVSLHTISACNFVTIGMDSTMHTTSARLIAEHHGLPPTHAPFAPTLPFPAVNLGLPALAAAAVRCGVTPTAATLATVPFTFFTFTLALYLLVRPWVPRFGAACLAVVGLIASRGLQETVCWGGYPTVAGFAVGLLATRVLFDLARRPCVGAGVVAGLLVAAIPLVHGIAGAVWVYVAGPLVIVVGLAKVRRWRLVLPVAAVAGAVTAAVFGAYLAFGHTELTDWAREWTRTHQAGFAPKGEGVELLRNAAADAVRWAGDEPAAGWLIAVGWLLVRGRWREAGVLLLGAALIFGLVVNSAFWKLPGSIALYPERAPYLLNALGALGFALSWRAVPRWSRRLKRGWAAVGVLLVLGCLPKYIDRYQRTVTLAAVPPESRRPMSFPVVGRDEYEALVWCRDHLDPARDLVQSGYNTAGSYLPPVAGVATTGWHVHCFILPHQQQLFAERPPTHRFVLLATDGEPPAGSGVEVFRNAAVVVLRLPRDPLFADAGSIGQLPDSEGKAGLFAGVSGGRLLLAGGAGFPNGRPWEGGRKVWSDEVLMQDAPGATPRVVGRLPRPLGYGASVTWGDSVCCFGGGNADGHFANGFRLRWHDDRLETGPRPALPEPCANMAWAVVGSTLHIAGGIGTPAAITCLTTHWTLDLNDPAGRWVPREPCPGAARMFAVGGSDGSAFYLFSGAALSADDRGEPKREYLRDCWKYTPAGGWRRLADLPRAAVAAASPAPLFRGRLYVLGGDDGVHVGFQPPDRHPGFPRTAFAYDPAADRWVEVAGCPTAKVCVPVVEWGGGYILPGGEPRPGVRDRSIDRFTPVR
jgi:hypothetical protein